jgi:ferritin
MISQKIQDAFNKQINAELYSAYLYLSMSAYFHSINLDGFANWMRVQAQEELTHVMKFYDHIHERDGQVTLTAVDGPPTEWASPLAAFEDAFRHEQKVTGLINELANLAAGERDHASGNFLQWFVDEQVEEEASANTVVQQLKLVGDNGHALFMMDRELAQRTLTQPAQ